MFDLVGEKFRNRKEKPKTKPKTQKAQNPAKTRPKSTQHRPTPPSPFPSAQAETAQPAPRLGPRHAACSHANAGPTRPHSLSPLRGADGLVPHASYPARAAARSLAAPPGPPVGAIPYLPSFLSELTEPSLPARSSPARPTARTPGSPHAYFNSPPTTPVRHLNSTAATEP